MNAVWPELAMPLEIAVALRLAELRALAPEHRDAWMAAFRASDTPIWLAEHGDALMFKSPGTREAFRRLVDAVCYGAHVPGGMTFLGRHWEETP